MAALHSRCGHTILPLYVVSSFFLSSFLSLFLCFFVSFFVSFFLFLSLFSSPVLSRHRLDVLGLSYFHTWCGLGANLECRSEMCCTRRAANTGRKKIAKNSPSAHNRTTLSGYIFAAKAFIRNRKKVLNSNTSSICPHNMLNFSPLTAEICSLFWGIQQIWTGFASWSRYCTDVAQRRSTNLCTMFGRLLGWYAIYTLAGDLAPTEFWQVQKSLCVQILLSPILAALLQGTRAVVVSQALRRSAESATWPVFGRAAITLGIAHILLIFKILALHKSFTYLLSYLLTDLFTVCQCWNKAKFLSPNFLWILYKIKISLQIK